MDWEEEGKGRRGEGDAQPGEKIGQRLQLLPDFRFGSQRGKGGDTRGQFPPAGSADSSGGAGARGSGASGRLREPCALLQVPACSAAPSTTRLGRDGCLEGGGKAKGYFGPPRSGCGLPR